QPHEIRRLQELWPPGRGLLLLLRVTQQERFLSASKPYHPQILYSNIAQSYQIRLPRSQMWVRLATCPVQTPHLALWLEGICQGPKQTLNLKHSMPSLIGCWGQGCGTSNAACDWNRGAGGSTRVLR